MVATRHLTYHFLAIHLWGALWAVPVVVFPLLMSTATGHNQCQSSPAPYPMAQASPVRPQVPAQIHCSWHCHLILLHATNALYDQHYMWRPSYPEHPVPQLQHHVLAVLQASRCRILGAQSRMWLHSVYCRLSTCRVTAMCGRQYTWQRLHAPTTRASSHLSKHNRSARARTGWH